MLCWVLNGFIAYVIYLVCCGGLGTSMFCYGSSGMSVYLNFWVKRKSSLLLKGPRCQGRSMRGRVISWHHHSPFLCTLWPVVNVFCLLILGVSDMVAERVLEQQHTVQSFLHWQFEHVHLYAGHQPLIQWTRLHLSQVLMLVLD